MLATGRRLGLAVGAAIVVDEGSAGDAAEGAVEAALIALAQIATAVLERAAEAEAASPARA